MSVNSAIITINEEGIIQSVDKGACQMFGYELDELMGEKVNKLLPTPYREQHDAYLMNYLDTGRKRIIGTSRLVEGMHKDTSVFPIRLAVSEVKVGDSRMFIGMIDKVEDTAGTVTANNDGIIISCNKQCEAIWGFSVSEMVGKNLSMLMPSPHRERHDSYIANYRRTGEMKAINHTRNVPARHKDGTVFPVSLQVTKLKVGVVELFKGRVDKVDTEMEAVFTLDRRGYIISCNKNFVTPLFGFTDVELVGKHIRMLVPSLQSKKEQAASEAAEAEDEETAENQTGCLRRSAKRKRDSTETSNNGDDGGGAESKGGSCEREEINLLDDDDENDRSLEGQTLELQNEMSVHTLKRFKGKDKQESSRNQDFDLVENEGTISCIHTSSLLLAPPPHKLMFSFEDQ